ncbi:hypothetical protein D3C87_1952060 [compost metagenome]
MENRTLIAEALTPRMGAELAKRAEGRVRGAGSLLRGATGASAASAPSFGSAPRVPSTPKGFA